MRRLLFPGRAAATEISGRQWQATLESAAVLQLLSADEQDRLRLLSQDFLQKKTFTGVDGLVVNDEMKRLVAAQACLLILELDMAYFNGWVEIVIYPAAFFVERSVSDEAGVVSQQKQLLSGEAWSRGQVILSWQDVMHDTQKAHAGHNLVLHEFAHKLDAQSGSANGMPPLHKDMSRQAWADTLSHAYNRLVNRVEHNRHGYINDYAATNPAEYFAVLTEYFFTAPEILKKHCEKVYGQLELFYRQQPIKRLYHHHS
ncbi:MAG TPA: zinc-dependent peptidase [Thiotrichales bacterium]|nr:zinc-dependent peptidase [Thiotrichales bacterium]